MANNSGDKAHTESQIYLSTRDGDYGEKVIHFQARGQSALRGSNWKICQHFPLSTVPALT